MTDPAWPPIIHYQPAQPGAEERMRVLAAEAERRFGNRTDAGAWYYNIQPGLGEHETPHRIAQRSGEGLQRVLELLASLDIKPRPEPYPAINRTKKKR